MAESIESIIATIDSIRVQHRYYLEYEAITKDSPLLTPFIRQKLPYAIKNKAGWRLARMNARRYEYGRLVEAIWTSCGISLGIWEATINQGLSFLEHLCFGRESNQFHRSALAAVIEHLAMDIDIFMILVSSEELLRVFKRLLERVGVGPGEVRSISLLIEIAKCVIELDLEVSIRRSPGQRPRTPLPLHRIWTNSINWPQAHLVEFALRRHSFDVKSEGLTILHALHAEIEPGVVMAFRCVGQAISVHPASDRVRLSILIGVASAQVA